MINLRDILIFFRSLISYILGISALIFFAPILFILVSLPPSKRYENKFLYRVMNLIYKAIVWAMLMPVKVEGQENIKGEPAIIIGNHQSTLDIPILGSVLHARPHIWFALIDFVNTPVLNYFIKKIGIWVDRTTSISGAKAVLRGIRLAQEYNSDITLFPEGGRFADGKVHEFLKGFAILAKRTKRRVVPVYMPNNWRIYPPGSFLLMYHQIRIIIGPPFYFLSDETEEQFVMRIHAWYDQKVRETQ